MYPGRQKITALAFVAALLGASTPSSAATNLVVTEKANHKIIKMKRGSELTISLNSTYWSLNPVPSTAAIVQNKKPGVFPIFPGPNAPAGCQHPGGGCGTLTWHFKAVKIGRTTITASRNSCGEAMQCAPNQKWFTIKVVVTK